MLSHNTLLKRREEGVLHRSTVLQESAPRDASGVIGGTYYFMVRASCAIMPA